MIVHDRELFLLVLSANKLNYQLLQNLYPILPPGNGSDIGCFVV